MPWVRFTQDFDWQPPNARWMITFRAGTVKLVKQVVADMAISAGKAESCERPKNPVRPENASG